MWLEDRSLQFPEVLVKVRGKCIQEENGLGIPTTLVYLALDGLDVLGRF
jgi:hypothetical protein